MKRVLLFLIFSYFLIGNNFSQTVYITKTGEKYHSSGCRYLKKSNIEIELQDALNQGYVACKICKPTQTVTKSTSNTQSDSNSQNNNIASQCTAYTKSGSRCKRTTKSSNGKCWQHGGN